MNFRAALLEIVMPTLFLPPLKSPFSIEGHFLGTEKFFQGAHATNILPGIYTGNRVLKTKMKVSDLCEMRCLARNQSN